jgi:hypothetical protein
MQSARPGKKSRDCNTDTHGEENSDRPCLSVSCPGATPAHRLGSFRGYLLATIFLAGVKSTAQHKAKSTAQGTICDRIIYKEDMR